MSSGLASRVLLYAGLIAVVAGIVSALFGGVRVEYASYEITIPEYRFKTQMPGNYTVVTNIPVEFVTVEHYITGPWYWVYPVEIPWVNCTGGDVLLVEFEAIVIPVGEQSLVLEVYGCRSGKCEIVFSDDLVTHATRVQEPYNGGYKREVLVGGMKYELNESFTMYEYLNITVEPVHLILRRLIVSSLLDCFFQYEAATPVTMFEGVSYKRYTITIPARVDTTLHQVGVAVSIVGLVLVLVALHVHVKELKHGEQT